MKQYSVTLTFTEPLLSTFFPDRGDPFLDSRTIKDFLTDACGMLRDQDDSVSSSIDLLIAYKRVIPGQVFIEERLIALEIPAETERPFMVCIPLGWRVEGTPIGTTATFTLAVLDDTYIPTEILTEWFDYGRYSGLGQWHENGFGRFTYEMTEIDATTEEEVIPPDKHTV